MMELANTQLGTERRRLVVEVGSEAIPTAFCAKRGIKENEYYVSVNTVHKGERFSAAENEAEKYSGKKNFSSIVADARSMPFADSTVDELIFNNVFGSFYKNSDILAAFLREASRVLMEGGEIHITEMNTPNFIPDEWFVGGRPDRQSDIKAEANSDYFQQFGLRVRKLSTDENDIGEYRNPFPGHNGFYPIAFTLTLEKVSVPQKNRTDFRRSVLNII